MSQGDLEGKRRRLSEEKRDWRGRKATGDGATSRSVKTFQFGNIGHVKERKPSG